MKGRAWRTGALALAASMAVTMSPLTALAEEAALQGPGPATAEQSKDNGADTTEKTDSSSRESVHTDQNGEERTGGEEDESYAADSGNTSNGENPSIEDSKQNAELDSNAGGSQDEQETADDLDEKPEAAENDDRAEEEPLQDESGNGTELENAELVLPEKPAVEAVLQVMNLALEVYREASTFDVTEESVVIGASGSAITVNGMAVDGRSVTVTGASSEHRVVVEEGTQVTVILQDVEINGVQGAALELQGDSSVTLMLEGVSRMTGADGFAAVQASEEAKLVIDSSENGSLIAQGGANGAGIGGGKNQSGGTIDIRGGVIEAFGGAGKKASGWKERGGAGIGSGGYDVDYDPETVLSGTIRISGGTVTAAGGGGGYGGAGIGGGAGSSGAEITISGGTVSAVGGGNCGGAGIGGGNHGNGGTITIDGTAHIVLAQGSGGGAGIGSGLGSSKGDDKGPGWTHSGHIIIDGDAVVEEAVGSGIGAGIGGGQYGDNELIEIKGGTIVKAMGSTSGQSYQGGAGIGAGYQGYCNIEIGGGRIIESVGANGAAGIGNGSVAQEGKREGRPFLQVPRIAISGGVVERAMGGAHAAGIGSGYGNDRCQVEISGGTIELAKGGEGNGDNGEFGGGAGIGSGYGGVVKKYDSLTAGMHLIIKGGADVYGAGAWGASGIGSGAANLTAEEIVIDPGASVKAVSDGTKFAVDSSRGAIERTQVNHTVLQGTFMNLEGLKGLDLTILEDAAPALTEGVTPGTTVGAISLPQGYRSFAISVDREGGYLVREADGYFGFNVEPRQREEFVNPENAAQTVHFNVSEELLGDHYFLYPMDVKEISGSGTDSGNTPDHSSGGGGGGNHQDNSGSNGAGGNESEGSTVVIPEEEVPLAETPQTPESAEGGGELVDLVDEPVPLSGLPETEAVVIEENAVPLVRSAGVLPQTGGTGSSVFYGSGGLLILLGLLLKRKWSRTED